MPSRPSTWDHAPDVAQETMGPLRFLDDPHARALLSDPGGASAPDLRALPLNWRFGFAFRFENSVGLHNEQAFRGSITRPMRPLSTLRVQGRPWTTQDSLSAGGQP